MISLIFVGTLVFGTVRLAKHARQNPREASDAVKFVKGAFVG